MTLFKKIAKMDAHYAHKQAKAYQAEKKAFVKALGEKVFSAYKGGKNTVEIKGGAADYSYIRSAVSSLGFPASSVSYDVVQNAFVLTIRK